MNVVLRSLDDDELLDELEVLLVVLLAFTALCPVLAVVLGNMVVNISVSFD
jgi:hypothetical protein